MVEEYDLDKNGKLDEEERAIYLEDRRRKWKMKMQSVMPSAT